MITQNHNQLDNLTLELSITPAIINSTNIDDYAEAIRSAADTINLTPTDDEEFAIAEQNVKALSKLEDRLKTSKEELLAAQGPIQNIFTTLTHLQNHLSTIRLKLTRAISNRKDEIKAEHIANALKTINTTNPSHIQNYKTQLIAAIKGTRSINGMDTRLRQTVDQINANIAAIHTIVSDYNTQIANSGILFDPAEYENCTPRETQLMLQTQYQLRLKAIREAEERKSSAIPPQPTPAPEQNPEHHPSLIPPPPMPPVSQGSQPTNPAEMRRFVQSLITAFSTVAEAKRQLRNPYNISRAETFATAVNDAWQTLATTLTPEEQQ